MRQVLMAEVASQPAVLGSTVFGYNDAYRRLRPFVLDWRAACAAAGTGGARPHHGTFIQVQFKKPLWCLYGTHDMYNHADPASDGALWIRPLVGWKQVSLPNVGKASRVRDRCRHDWNRPSNPGPHSHVWAGAPPAPYLVSFDVSRAFDCVDVTRLLDLVEPLLGQRDYLLVKYVEVRGSGGQQQAVLKWRLLHRTGTGIACAGRSYQGFVYALQQHGEDKAAQWHECLIWSLYPSTQSVTLDSDRLSPQQAKFLLCH